MKKGVKILTGLMTVFVLVLLVIFLLNGNAEFSGYGIVVLLLFYLVVWMNEKYDFPLVSLWLFAIWIALHLLGGSVYTGGTRLYDLMLVNFVGAPYFILKYDQLIHMFCYFAITLLTYFVLKRHMNKKAKWSLIVFAVLSALGISLLNEVIEFGMVVFADAADAVGGYTNTALDMVFNLVGSVAGVTFARKVLD